MYLSTKRVFVAINCSNNMDLCNIYRVAHQAELGIGCHNILYLLEE